MGEAKERGPGSRKRWWREWQGGQRPVREGQKKTEEWSVPLQDDASTSCLCFGCWRLREGGEAWSKRPKRISLSGSLIRCKQ